MVSPSASLATRLVVARFVLRVDAFFVWTVHMKTVSAVCAAPAFTVELNPKEIIASVGSGYCTTTDETGRKMNKQNAG